MILLREVGEGDYFFTSQRCGVESAGGGEKAAVHFGNFGSSILGRFPVIVLRNSASALLFFQDEVQTLDVSVQVGV